MTSPPGGGSEAAALAVEDLGKRYADGERAVQAVDSVSFTVTAGSFYTLLGPSGCGKTTTLRCVAGLERADRGRVCIAGEPVSDAGTGLFIPSHRRDVGMVFQSYAIWPHLSVFENVAFPLKVTRRRLTKVQLRERVERALAAVHLAGYEDRASTALSGGQQQRLALARALVREPRLLLLDEPLSNLDAKLREAMRVELRDLQHQLGVTTMYVTHDQSEAFAMSDRIAVLSDGRIVQEGNARDIYQRPTTRFVADFVGRINFFDARVAGPAEQGRTLLDSGAGALRAGCPAGCQVGEQVTVAIRPENVLLHVAPAAERPNTYPGEVDRVVYLGEKVDADVRVGDVRLTASTHPTQWLRPGSTVTVELPPALCTVLSEEHGMAGGEQSDHPPEDQLLAAAESPS